MTTLRAPYKTRGWSETEVAALRSMVKTGKDVSTPERFYSGWPE
jgi:hypothetical protein